MEIVTESKQIKHSGILGLQDCKLLLCERASTGKFVQSKCSSFEALTSHMLPNSALNYSPFMFCSFREQLLNANMLAILSVTIDLQGVARSGIHS
jgi:hypothetical protein